MTEARAIQATFYRNYLLWILMALLACNYIDRYALGLVQEEIKAELRLSDSQLGLLSGIAFALFYSVMGIPIARWADRGNRVTIISITAAVWSVAVVLCGTAANFAQLMLIRIGVGVGEAGCVPPAHSLIADHFNRAERARAVSIYMQGASLSVVLGYFVAGWLNELYGWRAMFVLLGIPGLVTAALARMTLKEPRFQKGRSLGGVKTIAIEPGPTTTISLMKVCRTLWSNRTFRHLLVSFSLVSFFNYGILNWQPAFFIRSFGLKTGELGTWFALIYGISTVAGIYVGGEWASRAAPNNEPLQLKTMAIANALFGGVIWALIYLASDYRVAFALMGIANLGSSAVYGPLFATFQTLVDHRMRAMSIAIVYLFANLIGLGMGPFAVGGLSDVLHPIFAEESLRYALLAFCPGFLWVSWHLWQAGKTVTHDLAALRPECHGVAGKISSAHGTEAGRRVSGSA